MLSLIEYEKAKERWNQLSDIREGDPREQEFDQLTKDISEYERSFSDIEVPSGVVAAAKQYE
jgi:hypothetical protein